MSCKKTKREKQVHKYLHDIVWDRYFYLEKKVFEDNCEGMTDFESNQAIKEMALIFNSVAPYIGNLGCD